jgi:hypothetical protein
MLPNVACLRFDDYARAWLATLCGACGEPAACLICNGPLAFDAATGEGATLEHIRARGRGGTDDLDNLAIVHGRCNWEKGRCWDPKKRLSQDEYERFIARLVERRQQRWRPSTSMSG